MLLIVNVHVAFDERARLLSCWFCRCCIYAHTMWYSVTEVHFLWPRAYVAHDDFMSCTFADRLKEEWAGLMFNTFPKLSLQNFLSGSVLLNVLWNCFRKVVVTYQMHKMYIHTNIYFSGVTLWPRSFWYWKERRNGRKGRGDKRERKGMR